MSQTAYQFDNAGLYAGETIADESPMEPGVYLLPARCTLTPPPEEIPDDKWPRWTGSSWTLVSRRVTQATQEESEEDPVLKLRLFLNSNPDVAEMIQSWTAKSES